MNKKIFFGIGGMLFLFLTFGVSAEHDIVVNLLVEPEYLYVEPGGDIYFQVSIVQLGDKEREDIVLRSFITLDNDTLISKRQTVAIETKVSVLEKLYIPKELNAGTYKVVVEARSLDDDRVLAEAAQRFFIVERLFSRDIKMLIIHVIFSILIMLLVLLVIILYIGNSVLKSKISELHKVTSEDFVKRRRL